MPEPSPEDLQIHYPDVDLGPNPDNLRVPPHNIHAEQSLLGGLMLDNSTWDRIADQVVERDLYRREHRLIFRAVAKLAENDQPFDVVTLAETLERTEQLEAAGGLSYLGTLVSETPSAANIKAYAKIVRETSVLRQMIAAGTDIADSAYNPQGREAAELLDAAERRVFEIAEQEQRGGGGFQPIKTLLTRAVERIDDLYRRDEPITGLATGFTDFDLMTSGLQPSDLIVVAGRPSMGKCLEACSEILGLDGSLATIETIVRRRRAGLLTLGQDWRLRPAEPTAFVDDGYKPVFRVTTRLGRTVETTATHPFLTVGGWRPLSELAPGEPIGVPGRLPVFGDQPMRECEVRILGYLLGDGALTGAIPKLTSAEPRVQADFTDAVQAFGGIAARLRRSRGCIPEVCVVADRRPGAGRGAVNGGGMPTKAGAAGPGDSLHRPRARLRQASPAGARGVHCLERSCSMPLAGCSQAEPRAGCRGCAKTRISVHRTHSPDGWTSLGSGAKTPMASSFRPRSSVCRGRSWLCSSTGCSPPRAGPCCPPADSLSWAIARSASA